MYVACCNTYYTIFFLSLGKNKEELVSILFKSWSSMKNDVFHGIELLVCHGSQCHRLLYDPTAGSVTTEEIDSLLCDHEEADTRLLLHYKHASKSYQSVVLKCADTDVFVLALFAYWNAQVNLVFDTGVGGKRRLVPIHLTAEKLGEDVCNALPGFHAFTGIFII